MQRLWPNPQADVDLDHAYAWPAASGQLVRANMVASADGAAALAGVTEQLSGPADRRLFAVLRGLADVILVGAATVRREGYGGARPSPARQEIRRAAGMPPAPPIAVVSGRLDLDPGGRFFTDVIARPLVITAESAPADRRAALAEVADVVVAGAAAVEIAPALDALAARGLSRVLCEGGPRLLAQVVASGRLDELCLTLSPCLTAGDADRVLVGPALPVAVPLGSPQVLAEDGMLFMRYPVRRPSSDA